MPTNTPPPLTESIIIRNPSERPALALSRLGEYLDTPENQAALDAWGDKVLSFRHDRAPRIRREEQGSVYEGTSVFTIRFRGNIAPNAEIVHEGIVYESQGPPAHRGGLGNGRASEYLEITTKLRV